MEIKKGKEMLRAGYGSKKLLIPLHCITNVETYLEYKQTLQ